MRRLLLSIAMLIASTIISCGGGGGGGATTTATEPTKAVVKISTSGALSAGTLIDGIEVTLKLPAGVTVKATPDASNANVLVTDAGVLVASGVSTEALTAVLGTYTASPNAVAINVVSPLGFGAGEFVTLNCDIAAGAAVKATDFTTGTLSAVDLNGAAIPGLTAGLTVDLQ